MSYSAFMNLNDRSGKFGSSSGRNGTTDAKVGNWSLAGKAILEIDATLLTVRPPSECRVWSKHFGQTYVRNRCSADSHWQKPIVPLE